MGHVQFEWQYPQYRHWYEWLAEKRMLIRYDGRGSGLSERDVTDFSLDAYMLDLEAVVERLSLERFVLHGHYMSGPVAIAYTARHPEQVSHLVLWGAWARASDIWGLPWVQGIDTLLAQDWNTFTETMAHISFGWQEGEEMPQYAAFIRESITQEACQVAMHAMSEVDVSDLLPHLRSPTLVLQRRQAPYPDVDVARRLASHIPDARLAIMEGKSPQPWGEGDAVLEAIDEFLGEGEPAAPPAAAPPVAGAFRTILFTDIEGSTALTQRLGDAKARELLRQHERIVREALKSHGGSEVKTMGDGFMASFGSAVKALECAVAIQRAFAERNRDVGAALAPPQGAASSAPTETTETIRVRIGLNAGEPIAEDNPDGRGDLFGTAVIRAARIAALAQGGEILVANVVRELAEGKGFLFGDRGEVALRGFDDPVRLFEVRWRSPSTELRTGFDSSANADGSG